MDRLSRAGIDVPGLEIRIVERCTSTNAVLACADDAHSAHPVLLAAEQQTAGRGRHGRRWRSARGAGATFSIRQSLNCGQSRLAGLSIAVGLSAARALRRLGARGVAVKWPNDLMCIDGTQPARKVGGVLIESVPVGQRRMAVIGAGLNIAPQPVVDVNTGFACLQEFVPEIDAPQALARIARPWIEAVLQFQRDGFAPFKARFERRDCLRGRVITTTLDDLPSGVAEGVDNTGALQVRVGPSLRTVGVTMPRRSAFTRARRSSAGAATARR